MNLIVKIAHSTSIIMLSFYSSAIADKIEVRILGSGTLRLLIDFITISRFLPLDDETAHKFD